MFPSYAAALVACATNPVNIQSSLLAKCDLWAWQILIDKAPRAQDHAIASYSEADILLQANHSIKDMSLSEPLVPLPKVLGIKKLPSSALFLEMDSEHSAAADHNSH